MAADITAQVTVPMVARLFPSTPQANIAANLPHVLAALSARQIGDHDMVCVALANIAAETASWEPVKEGAPSEWNTSPGGQHFDLYDNRQDLGNGPHDGPLFPGRGFIQLTGRSNYAKYGPEVGADLIADPDLACDPVIAAKLLAAFLADKEPRFRVLLAADNLDYVALRRLVNGGINGMTAFQATFDAADDAVPMAMTGGDAS